MIFQLMLLTSGHYSHYFKKTISTADLSKYLSDTYS